MLIPDMWKAVLKEVQQVFPDAVIGGGCLRDLYFNKEPKDIDIFISNSTNDQISKYLCECDEITVARDMPSYNGLSNSDVTRVITCTWKNLKADDLPVELIAVSVDKDAILNRFDYGICQITYDGDKIHYTSRFIIDSRCKCFTLVRCDNQDQFNRSFKRWERLSERYPEFIFNVGEYGKYAGPRSIAEV